MQSTNTLLIVESSQPLSYKYSLNTFKKFVDSTNQDCIVNDSQQRLARVPDEVLEKIKFMVTAMEEEIAKNNSASGHSKKRKPKLSINEAEAAPLSQASEESGSINKEGKGVYIIVYLPMKFDYSENTQKLNWVTIAWCWVVGLLIRSYVFAFLAPLGLLNVVGD
eukprot:gene8173-16798_t